MINSIKTRPYVILFKTIILFGSLGLAIWKIDSRVGYSSSDQGDIEQFFRLIIGSIVLYIPSLLVYAVVYWLMHRFKRPTRPNLNLWHIRMICLSIIIGVGYGLFTWYDDSPITLETSLGEYLLMIISSIVPLIFLYNVIISLVKPQKLETTPENV